MINHRRKRWPKIVLGQLMVTVLIFSVSTVIIFYAQGYRVNFKNFKIVKTGILYIECQPKPDYIIVSRKEYQAKKSNYYSLPTGYYNVEIKKEGYITWSGRIKIESESVSDFSNILIFKENILTDVLNDAEKIDKLNQPNCGLVEENKDGLSYNNYEIWLNENIVTRFSEPIKNVEWYPDMNHIVLQVNNQILISDKDGSHITSLIKLEDNKDTKYFISSSGKEIYIRDGDEYFSALIQ